MKTISIAATLLIMFTASLSMASTSKRTLAFVDSFGRMLSVPVKVEAATDTVPFYQTETTLDSESGKSERVFDISGMSKPEAAEEIPAEVQALFTK